MVSPVPGPMGDAGIPPPPITSQPVSQPVMSAIALEPMHPPSIPSPTPTIPTTPTVALPPINTHQLSDHPSSSHSVAPAITTQPMGLQMQSGEAFPAFPPAYNQI